MGTTYEIKIRDIYPEKIDFLSYAIDSILLSINQSMSTYMQDSEISFINNDLKSFEPLELSEDFNYVLDKSLDYYVLTEGAFDVTVRPLLRLWGFRGVEIKNVPKTPDINNIMKYVGSDNIISMDASIIKHSDLEIDFGAIAKGFGVDKISDYLISQGFLTHYVEIGGEIICKGKIGTYKLLAQNFYLIKVMRFYHLISTIATSGTYNQFIEIDDYSILISLI